MTLREDLLRAEELIKDHYLYDRSETGIQDLASRLREAADANDYARGYAQGLEDAAKVCGEVEEKWLESDVDYSGVRADGAADCAEKIRALTPKIADAGEGQDADAQGISTQRGSDE